MKKKSKHTALIELIQEIATIGKTRGLLHQYTEDYNYDGRSITINGEELINFGSCSYLGLETDRRVKDGAIDAIERYGSQLACSRAFLSNTLYSEFEELIRRIFDCPILIAPTTSVGHQAVMPTVIEDDDAIILDQQAHWSMQDVASKMQLRGITVIKVRHSRLDELEAKIRELSGRHSKIWYVIDGIYSMYGDPAPLKELVALLGKIKQLHLYIDDAHGISWAGKNGRGFTLSQVDFHPKMIVATSLGKAFANAGGVFLFPNEELCWKVKSWGGLLSQSGPQPPAVLGACIATAKIHLSDEIYERQTALADRIEYCNALTRKYDLPLVFESPAPIFFLGLGLPRVSYNLTRRLLNEGQYVNLAVFPVVPESCTGIRFAVTLHHSYEDIEKLITTIARHLPLALQEEGRTMEDIYKAFKSLKYRKDMTRSLSDTVPRKTVQHETSIRKLDREEWNTLFANNGILEYDMLLLLEDSFRDNDKPEDNWAFHYYLVRDINNKIIAATFFTITLSKNDMLSSAEVSRIIEQERKQNPYYQTSRTMMMGSLLTEDNHLYLDRSDPEWKNNLAILLDSVAQVKDSDNIDLFLIRDFDADDNEIGHFFIDQGFIKVDMLPTHALKLNFGSKEDYINSLPGKKRKRVKDEILKFERCYTIHNPENLSNSTLESFYSMYENVYDKSLELNVFKLPKKLFINMAKHAHFDFIELRLKKEYIGEDSDRTIAIGCSYKSQHEYRTLVLGMDYRYAESYNGYKQILFQAISRGIELKKSGIALGLTGSGEKRKLGALKIPKVGFAQLKDDFDITALDLIPESKKQDRD